MAESMGYKSAMAINPIGGGTTTFNGSSVRLEFLSHDIKETIALEQDEGLRGTRTRASERVALGNIAVGGSVTFEPTPVELEALMPFILGSASSAGSYAVAETLPDLYMMIDQIAEVNTYLLRVNKATFSGEPGKKIQLKLDLVGKTMTTGAAGSFPGTVPAMDLSVRPYMFYDMGSGITIASTAYSIDKFELVIDNKIQPTYMQGQTATDLEPTDRVITLGIQTKYVSGTETALFTAIRAGTAQSASISFVNNANTMSFTFGKLVGMSQSVVVPGRQHLRLPLNYQCFGISTTKEIVATLPA